MRDDPDIQGAFLAMANEVDRLDAAIADVVTNYFPQLAADYLYLWEAHLGISVNPTGLSVAQRQQRVMSFVALRTNSVPGRAWVKNVTALLGPGWTWTRHTPGSSSGVAAHTIQINLPYVAGSAQATDLIALLEKMTPANTQIVINYGSKFIVQESQIQFQPL
jgi:uncharacterized protein YmfQ (DUF2313 family)